MMSEQFENEITELGVEFQERVFVLDKNGHFVPLEIQDDVEV